MTSPIYRIQIYISPELSAWIESQANGVSDSIIVRTHLEEMMAKNQKLLKRKATAKKVDNGN
jgi:hypothetical protein